MIKNLLVKLTPLSFTEYTEKFLLKHYQMSKNFLANTDPNLIEKIGEKKALAIFKKAAIRIPAYSKFLKKNKIDVNNIKSIKDFNKILPETTKENYVKINKIESLCLDGELPSKGIIEESAGSSGHPTNWIKSAKESYLLDKEVGFESNYLLDLKEQKTIILSCWSPGPWTTDLKFCEFFEHQGLIKNVGPDINGVIETIKRFGPKYHYLIAGYPPFCRILFEKTQKKMNWKKYKVDVLVGGEGFVMGWRDHLREVIGNETRIFSAYGASDVDIGVAFETPLSVMIRKILTQKKELRNKFCKGGRYPMVFQYNPLAHYISNLDVNNKGDKVEEFTITPLDTNVVSPKVKYNLHDHGRRISFIELIDLLKMHGGKTFNNYLKKNKRNILHLPFLVVYGRSDGTLSINGTNIHPQQIELALMKNKEIFDKTHTFRINDKNEGKTQVVIKVELKTGIKPSSKLEKICFDCLVKNLPKVSEEYEQALKEFPDVFFPSIELHPFGSGPFTDSSSKIKHKYIG